VRGGLAPNQAVVLLYAVAAFFGAASLLTVSFRSQVIGLVVIAMSVATWLGLAQLRSQAPVPASPGPESMGFRQPTTLAALWDELVARAAECGFVRVELFASESTKPLLEGVARGSGLPSGFPEWRSGTPAGEPIVSWRVPLVSEGLHLGTLVLARGVRDDARVGALAAAIEGDFASRWLALLQDAAIAPAPAVPEGLGDAPALRPTDAG
jgi:hypothetical protein